MIHELKEIIYASYRAKQQHVKSVLISVVGLNGSSYRKPGVRMLLHENGHMIGAISGGCVENEVKRQATSVFNTGQSKIMEYDGRFRLGCEGVLKILIEPFVIQESQLKKFQKVLKDRKEVEVMSYYSEEQNLTQNSQSTIIADTEIIYSNGQPIEKQNYKVYNQTLSPEFQLYIFGVEHDAKALCQFAALTGWNVCIIDTLKGNSDVSDFPGAKHLIRLNEDEIEQLVMDKQTAIVIMTHSFVKDLKYLIALAKLNFAYLGVLGAKKRKEKLINALFEYCPHLDSDFIELIHSPCGLDIGAITPQEISISILSEILAVCRQKTPFSLNQNSLLNV